MRAGREASRTVIPRADPQTSSSAVTICGRWQADDSRASCEQVTNHGETAHIADTLPLSCTADHHTTVGRRAKFFRIRSFSMAS